MDKNNINKLSDLIRTLSDIVNNKEFKIIISNDTWESKFLIDYLNQSKELFSSLINEVDYKTRLIENLENRVSDLKNIISENKNVSKNEALKEIKKAIKELPIKNKVYSDMIEECLSKIDIN